MSMGRPAVAGRSARPQNDLCDRQCIAPSLASAVELRLGKIRRRRSQDFVGPLKLEVLALQLLQTLAIRSAHSCALTFVTLRLLHPASQGLAGTTDLSCDRLDRGPLRAILIPVLRDHPHRTVPNFC